MSTSRPTGDAVPPRARRAYELGRARRAAIEALPALVFPAVLLAEGASPLRALVSLGLYVTAAVALWLGQSAGAAAWPALLFGVAPFAVVRIAESAGHVCMGSACVSWCLPACLVGGALGGLFVGLRSLRASDRFSFALTAAALVFLSGAVGCECAGAAGMAGVALGVAAGSAAPFALARG
jgi:hypothetical protein